MGQDDQQIQQQPQQPSNIVFYQLPGQQQQFVLPNIPNPGDGFDPIKHGVPRWAIWFSFASLVLSIIGTGCMCASIIMIYFLPWPICAFVASGLCIGSTLKQRSNAGITISAVVFAVLSMAGAIACLPVIGIIVQDYCADTANYYGDDYSDDDFLSCKGLKIHLIGALLLTAGQILALVVASKERHRYSAWQECKPPKTQIIYVMAPQGMMMPNMQMQGQQMIIVPQQQQPQPQQQVVVMNPQGTNAGSPSSVVSVDV